jgi:hypothetical protein
VEWVNSPEDEDEDNGGVDVKDTVVRLRSRLMLLASGMMIRFRFQCDKMEFKIEIEPLLHQTNFVQEFLSDV